MPIFLRFHVARSKKEGRLGRVHRDIGSNAITVVQLHQPEERHYAIVVSKLLMTVLDKSGNRQTVKYRKVKIASRRFLPKGSLETIAGNSVVLLTNSFHRDVDGAVAR